MRSASGTQGPWPPGAPYDESSVAPLVPPLDNGALAAGGDIDRSTAGLTGGRGETGPFMSFRLLTRWSGLCNG